MEIQAEGYIKDSTELDNSEAEWLRSGHKAEALKTHTVDSAIGALEDQKFKKILLPSGDAVVQELTKNMLLLAHTYSIKDSIEKVECFLLVETLKKQSYARVHNAVGGLTPRLVGISIRAVGSTEGDLCLPAPLCIISKDSVDFETYIFWKMKLKDVKQKNYIETFLRNQGIISQIPVN